MEWIITLFENRNFSEGLAAIGVATFSIFIGALLWPFIPKILSSSSVEDEDIDKKYKDKGLEETSQAPSRDITRHKEVLSKLAEKESLLNAIVENVPTGILSVNREGKITLANKSLEKMFGYEKGELKGQVVEVIIPKKFKKGGFFATTGHTDIGI